MSESDKKGQSKTIAHAIFAGSVAGAAEVCSTGQILWSLKTRAQNNRPFTLNPWELARGMPLNALSMVPITALQVGFNQLIYQVYFQNGSLSDSERITTAFTAGVIAASVAGPTEMVMTHHRKDEYFHQAFNNFAQKYSVRTFCTGLTGTAIRDGFFSAAYLAGTPLLYNHIKQYCDSERKATVLANGTSGVLAAVLSHPFDTIKSRQQSEMPGTHAKFLSTANNIFAKTGFQGFFAGGLWRGARVVTAVATIGYVTNAVEDRLKPKP
jgi:solute carrier family 25 citrate transporter 1